MDLVVTRMDNYFPIYIHMPKLFMGYRNSSKDYRIYILGSRKIEVSRDVTFEEEMVI